MSSALCDGDRVLLAAIEAIAGADGWCDRSVPCLCDVVGARTGRAPHASTVYRQLARLRAGGYIATEARRIAGRLRTCHRVVLREADDVAVAALLQRIAYLEARIAEIEGGARPAPAANGEAERVVAQVAAAEVYVADLPAGPTVVAAEDVPRVEAAGLRVRRRSAYPRGAARIPDGPASLAAVRQAIAEGEDAESLLWLLTWYHAATIDRPDQKTWWGMHVLRPKIRARARELAGAAEHRHRERLEAALRRAGPLPRDTVDPDERARAAAALRGFATGS